MLTQLGSKAAIPASPEDAVLEKILVEDKYIRDSVVRLSCPEFTSLCPITAQPDFAQFYIDYVPDKYLIESKSLKLFLGSFRNHGTFHEACTATIGSRLYNSLEPQWMQITGIWFPRGGISIDIFWQKGSLPRDLRVPPLKLFPYVGR